MGKPGISEVRIRDVIDQFGNEIMDDNKAV
jgi:hypothetical protein